LTDSDSEGVVLAEDTLNEIMLASRGDMRKAVTYLQSAQQLCGGPTGTVISTEMIVDISGKVPRSIMEKLWSGISHNNFDLMKDIVSDIISEGYPMAAILSQIHDDVVEHDVLKDLDKALICEKIASVRCHYCPYHLNHHHYHSH